ncbi:hypothetical protein KUTeg_017205 [Tegillarca granosa]|uniref:Uncharacterized protein n=1 Tax=Tegillarca granosa TaxID=220873 RepID=A0ABQ9EIV9_TEGGR|nr:hypothetical protein KUTeg_017205 [Tegillarca granosa]
MASACDNEVEPSNQMPLLESLSKSKMRGAYPVVAECKQLTLATSISPSPADILAKSTNTFNSFRPAGKKKQRRLYKDLNYTNDYLNVYILFWTKLNRMFSNLSGFYNSNMSVYTMYMIEEVKSQADDVKMGFHLACFTVSPFNYEVDGFLRGKQQTSIWFVFCELGQIEEPRKGKYRLNYDAEDITKAFVMTELEEDVIKSGPDPLFRLEEELQLFDHISTMAEIGYGYTWAETLNLASDYSVHLGHRDRQHPLYNFCKDKPETVFNIDEKGLSTDCKPPNIIAATSYKPQVVTTGKTKTVIGSGNAIGNQVPPYFIFPGRIMVSELLNGASVGVQGKLVKLVDISEMYLKEQLIKHLPARDINQKPLTPSNIQSAFKKSGIYPFDPSVIPDTALAPALSFPMEVVPTAANVTTSTASDLTCPSSSNVNLCNHSNDNTKNGFSVKNVPIGYMTRVVPQHMSSEEETVISVPTALNHKSI